jgi:hypothetical protein
MSAFSLSLYSWPSVVGSRDFAKNCVVMYVSEAEGHSDGEDAEDEGQSLLAANDFSAMAKAADLAWAAVLLIENYRYPPAAQERAHPSNWILEYSPDMSEEEAVIDVQGLPVERIKFRETSPDDGRVLPGTALLMLSTSGKRFTMKMREDLEGEASGFSLTVVLHVLGSVDGEVTNLNVSRREPRIEVHSGRVFPLFAPLADFTDFHLVPTASPTQLRRVTSELGSILQRQHGSALSCTRLDGGLCHLKSVGGVRESQFVDDGRDWAIQVAAAMGVLPARVVVLESGTFSMTGPSSGAKRTFDEMDRDNTPEGFAAKRRAIPKPDLDVTIGPSSGAKRTFDEMDRDNTPEGFAAKRRAIHLDVTIFGEPLDDIGQLPVARPLSPEVLFTGALEGDVVESITSGRLSFFVVAPEEALQPRRRRVLDGLRKPTENTEIQAAVFLDARAVTETRYRELLKEEDEVMRPLADVDTVTRLAPRRTIRNINAIVGSPAFREARGNAVSAKEQVALLGAADAVLGARLEAVTKDKHPVIWKEDAVLEAIAQAVYGVRYSDAKARAFHGLSEELYSSGSDSGAESDGEDVKSVLSSAGLTSEAEEEEAEEEGAAWTAHARNMVLSCRNPETLAVVSRSGDDVPPARAEFAQLLASALRRIQLSPEQAAHLQDPSHRRAWHEIALETSARFPAPLLPRQRREFWLACAGQAMFRHVAIACATINGTCNFSLVDQLDVLNEWVAAAAA